MKKINLKSYALKMVMLFSLCTPTVGLAAIKQFESEIDLTKMECTSTGPTGTDYKVFFDDTQSKWIRSHSATLMMQQHSREFDKMDANYKFTVLSDVFVNTEGDFVFWGLDKAFTPPEPALFKFGFIYIESSDSIGMIPVAIHHVVYDNATQSLLAKNYRCQY